MHNTKYDYPMAQHRSGETRFPLAEAIASRVAIGDCIVLDRDVAELYGYESWLFDEMRAIVAFQKAYRMTNNKTYPTEIETEAALDVLEQRVAGANLL